MKKLIVFLTILISTLIAQQVPGTITFQGLLKDAENQPYADGQYELVFRLYQPSAGTTDNEVIVWEESHAVDVKDGIFSTLLGSELPLPDELSADLSLEIQVGEEVLSPRQHFSAVPFSLHSKKAELASEAVFADSSGYAAMAEYVLNAPAVDSANFAHHAAIANFSDSSGFADNAHMSMHAVHADSSDYSNHSMHAMHAMAADSAGVSQLSMLSLIHI